MGRTGRGRAEAVRLGQLRRLREAVTDERGRCASLPKVTASPPSSCHQRRMVACSGSRVLISNARPDWAVARNAQRNSSSNTNGSNGPACSTGQDRTG